MLLPQVPIYALNQHLVFTTLSALDIGGSITIHVFGAYYGLAASMVFSTRRQRNFGTANPKNGSSYISNIFSMIGTLFLWIYWPSFNGALASLEAHGHADPIRAPQQYYCVVNTLLSLLGSCIATFAMSAVLTDGRLDMMHIQNATLAGGVAMGSAAGLRLSPGGAMLVGLVAGSFSTFGFARLLPMLERRLQLGDTCGVHNLHGMPGIIGGLVAGFAAFNQPAGMAPHGTAQLGYQVAAVAVTVVIAGASGALAAAVISRRGVGEKHEGAMLDMLQLFDDGMFWAEVECEGTGGLMGGTEPSGRSVSARGVTMPGFQSGPRSPSGSHRAHSNVVKAAMPTTVEEDAVAVTVNGMDQRA
jgi:ammonium transporter Rh